jgi:hypothetical protein
VHFCCVPLDTATNSKHSSVFSRSRQHNKDNAAAIGWAFVKQLRAAFLVKRGAREGGFLSVVEPYPKLHHYKNQPIDHKAPMPFA